VPVLPIDEPRTATIAAYPDGGLSPDRILVDAGTLNGGYPMAGYLPWR
jgi:hypothetical protein